jgi:RHS repeat-associated protein
VTSYAGTTGTVVQQTEYYPSGTAYVEGTGAGIQPFKFTGKELIIMHGLNWQDYGARWLDNVRMQWTTMDPLCEKYYAISPYTYCSDDPARFVDKDGKIITIPNEKDRKQILTMVNSRAAGTFGINKQGELYVIKKEGTSGYSTYYRDRLIQAIGSKDKVNININSLVTVSGGKVINVDKVAGGGITLTGAIKNSETGKILGKWASVTISGNKNETQKDSNGNTLISESKDILMHELVGHSIPAIVGSDTGNAVDDENKVRAQYPEGQNQQRQRDPDHIE